VEGIAPRILFEQVQSTAAWALDGPVAPATSFRAVLRDLDAAERGGLGYFRALLAAHFCTVATFVPTDVDARIRHHAFTAMSVEELGGACDLVDEASGWDVRLVSARVVGDPPLSGHDGEWLAVRAGALGRALALGEDALAARLTEAIDEELAREHRILDTLERGEPIEWLRAATTVAHNLGDLSRVANELPIRERYARLGHERSRFGDTFVRAGAINKELLSVENHRYLALRKARGLRRSRALLLPIGPFFDDWGKVIATHDTLDERDRAEVVAALLSVHVAKPDARGVLRALAGIHAVTPRGLAAFEPMLPARMRKLVSSGPVREALKTTEEAFLARMRRAARPR
jgi:hypothetical protein